MALLKVICWATHIVRYTARNATDLLQVVDFTGLLQVVNKLRQVCRFHQVAPSLRKSDLL